jgi:hypothetical protein
MIQFRISSAAREASGTSWDDDIEADILWAHHGNTVKRESVKVVLNQWFICPSFAHFSTAIFLYIDWIVCENAMKRVALQFMSVTTTFVRSFKQTFAHTQ